MKAVFHSPTVPVARFFRLLSVLLGPVFFAVAGFAQPVIDTPATAFTAAESGRTFMTVGNVWNGSAKVGTTTGDTFGVTYSNSGDATAFDLALSVTLPTGFSYVPGTATVSTTPATPGLTVSASQAGSLLTFTLTLAGSAYDLPAASSITLNYGLTTATTVGSGTYQLTYSENYSLTNGGALGSATTAQQNILVQGGATTVNITPSQQTLSVNSTAPFTVTVTNTGLGGIFDVTINESSIYPTGNNLGFLSLAKTAPALAATSSNGGSILTLPYLAPGASFTANATATVLSCGTIVNNVASVNLANSTPVTGSASVQINLLQPLVAYAPATVNLDYNIPTAVTLTINNTGLGSAYAFELQSTLNNLPLTVSSVAAGWTYTSGTGLFTYTANSGTIANGGSATLSFNVAPTNICSASGAGTVNYVATYNDGCGDAYTIPQQSQSFAAASDTPSLSLSQSVSSNRIAIQASGSYQVTLSAANPGNISTDPIVVTETLPASITYLSSIPSAGAVGVAGQILTWTVPKAALSSSQTLAINFSVNPDPCNAGTQPTATATTSGTSSRSCPLSASASASFLISNNPGLIASQYFDVTNGANGTFYETGKAAVTSGVRNTGEGEQIPFEANYTFGPAYPGTWTGSTYVDHFGGVTGMTLVPGSLTYRLDGGGAIAVPGGSVTTLAPGFSIDLGFLGGAVAGHSVTFDYRTTAPDSALGGGSALAVTQLTTFTLAGAGTGTSGGCNTPLQSTFTQGVFYTIERAAATIGISMNSSLEVCKNELLTLTIGNGNVEQAHNLLVTLQNSGAPFAYDTTYTPVYGGVFTSGTITYNANGGTNPTFAYTGPLTGAGTIQVQVRRKSTGDTSLTGFSAKVDYDSWQTTAAGSRVYTASASYAPSSVRKATLALNVTPGSVTVTSPTISYVTYVTNTDAGIAYGAVLTNTLPAGITIDQSATNTANPSYPVTVSGQDLSWALGDVASGLQIPIKVVANVGVASGCSVSYTTQRISATWGCDGSISTVSRLPPAFVFPAGQMQVVNDSTNTVARLCDLGEVMIVVKNTGSTNIEGVTVQDVVPPSAGFSISGTVQYSTDGGASYVDASAGRTGTGASGSPYTWTSTAIPPLAELVPVGVSGTNQVNIKFNLAATEILAGQSPALIASGSATISCGSAVTSPAATFTIPVFRPSITVAKTGSNITAGSGFGSTVYGGNGDTVQWKIVVTNNGNATASNVRLTDPLSGSGGTAVINGPGLAANTPFTSGLIISLPDIAQGGSATYVITEILGNNCLLASPTASVTWGCINKGANVASDVSTPGSPTSAATIVMVPVLSGTQLTQTVTQLSGGRGKVVVNFTNNGGTAYNPVITATIPAGSTFDTTGPVTFTSTNTSITGVSTNSTNFAAPVFTLTGPSTRLVRYGESASVTYYVRPTVYDTTFAAAFPNLASPETTGNGLDPTPPATANITAQLAYTDSCGNAGSQTNNVSYDPLTPDLDINLTYPGDVLLTDTSSRDYVFTITNNGDTGSIADFITIDVPGLGSGWTVNSITLTTPGTGGTGGTISVDGATPFTTGQVGTLASGQSAVVKVNAAYRGTPGPLTLILRVHGEARAYDGNPTTGNYYSLDQGGIRVVGVTLSKSLVGTSETISTDPNVLIGEEATFHINATFFGAAGDLSSIDIRDTPANSSGSATGLAYVSSTANGSNKITPDSITVGGSAPSGVNPPTSSSNSRIDFTRSTLLASDINAGNNVFDYNVVARTLNISGNTNATSLPNNLGVSFTYLGQTFASSNSNDNLSGTTTSAGLHASLSPSLSVNSPAPTITKTVRNRGDGTSTPAFTASITGQAGDVIEYKLVVTNSAASGSICDLVVSDPVNAKLVLSTIIGQFGVDTNADNIVDQNSTAAAISGNTITFNETNTVYGSAGSNLTRLDHGNTITFLYRGTLATSVNPSENLNSTASLICYSVPVNGSLQAIHQTGTTGTANATNSGGTAPIAARSFSATNSATLTGLAIAQSKSLVSTSVGGDTSPYVDIGEQVHYRISVQLPLGTSPDLIIKDVLPAGLTSIGTPTYSVGSNISSGGYTYTLSSQTLTWDFGACVTSGSNNSILIDYYAQVSNSTGNLAAGTLTNNASYSYDGTNFSTVTSVVLTIAEPSVTVTNLVRNFTRSPSGTFVTSIVTGDATNAPDAGDILQYQVTITNASGTTVSPAYDLAFGETLPAGTTFVAGSTAVTSSPGLTGTLGAPDVSGQSLKWGRNQSSPVTLDLAPGGSLTFTYKATVDDTSKPVQTYQNAFVADWTSLPGAPGPNLGVAVDTPGNLLGERIGTGTSPNTYRSALSTTVTSRNTTTIAKVKSGDTLPLSLPAAGFRIGDLVTYTVTVTAQEGTLTPFIVSDVLPTGLAFVNTVSILPATGTVPFTYTTPIAGATAPSPGATGTLTWNLGTLVNAGNNLPDNTLTLVYTARVLNTGGIAVPGVSPLTTTTACANSATASYQNFAAGTLTTATSVASLNAEQPRLTLAKAVLSPAADSLGNYVRRPGDTASFQLTVANNGTAPAYNIRLTDTLPAGLRGTAPVLTAATLNGANVLGTLSAATWTAAAGTYVFDLADTEILLPAQTLVLTYTVTVDNNSALKGSTLSNSATINQYFSKASSDLTERRQYAPIGPVSKSIVVGLRIDGSVYQDVQPNNAKDAGEDWSGATKPVVYANLVTTGGSPAVYSTVTINPGTGLFAFDYLPPGTYNVVVTNSAVATVASRPANWLFQSPATGTINEVLTNADLTAQDLGLNQGSYAAPKITKIESGDTLPTMTPSHGFRIGDLVTYTVTINPQEGTLGAFHINDTLPAGFAYDTSIAPTISPATGGRYNYTTSSVPANGATGTISWNFSGFTNTISGPVTNATPSAIAAANTLTFTYYARVRDDATGTSPAVTPIAVPGVSPASTSTFALNIVNVSYYNPPPVSATVSASADPGESLCQVEQPRLTVAKVLLTPALNRMAPGASGQFKVTVTNDGTAPAYNVRLTDTLPTGMRGTAPSLVSTTLNGSAVTLAPAPTWTTGSGTYVFNLSDAQILQPGQTFVAIYNFTVDAGATRGATLTNSAVVNQFFSKASSDTTQRRQYAATPAVSASVIVGIQISGSVYSDANNNGSKNAGETWSGANNPTVYVNLLSGGAVYASATVAAGTGAYSFPDLPAGTYDLILTDSATSTTATRPANWPFQTPSNGKYSGITLTNADVANENLGLYQSTLAAPTIVKSESGDTLTPSGFRVGDLVTYTVDIQPQEGALTSFQVTDALPAGLAFDTTVAPTYTQVSGTPRFTYAAPTAPANGATGLLTWNFGAFTNALNGPSDNTLRIVYSARVIDTGTGALATPGVSPAATNSPLSNAANVSYTNPAVGPVSAGPSTSIVTASQPRLTVAKVLTTPASNLMAPGAAGTFTVTVANNGTAPAYDLTLTDTFPVGLRGTAPVLASATLNGSSATVTPVWTSGTGTYVFTLADGQPINAGASLVVTYSFAVDNTATRAATLTNAATITEFFSKPSTDTTSRRHYTPGLSSGAPVVVGLQISGFVYNDLNANNTKDSGEDWTGAPSVYVNLVNTTTNTVTASALVNTSSGVFTFTDQPSAIYNLIVATTATATTASRPDNWPFKNPSNGTLSLGSVGTDLANEDFGLYQGSLVTASIAKTRATGTLPLDTPADGFRIGDLVTYTLDIQPQEGALTGFKVTDALPAGLTFNGTTSIAQVSGTSRFSYTTPAGTDAPALGATGTVTWNFGTFTNALLGANNNTLRIIYTARVTDNGTGALATTPTTVALNNSAGVSFVNSSSVSIAAGPATSSLNVEQPLLTIAKTRLTPVATNVVRPGDTVSFSLTVTNTGAAPAYNVAVQDLIPSGMRSTTPVLNSATLNGVNILSTLNVPGWNSGTGAWTFALVDAQFNVGGQIEYILPGQTLVLNYTVTVDNNSGLRGSTLNNSATVQAYYSQLVSNPTQRRTYSSVGPVTQAIIIGLNVDGYVFNDLIANGVKDTGEDWTTGTPVYVNVVDTGTGMVVASDSIPIGNGYYSFTALAPGTYNFVLTTSSGSTTATAPATWMFRAPVGGSLPITLTTSDLTGQNFGLFQGHTLSGRVFRDNGIGGGTANDGVINGTEAGIGNVTVLLLSSSFTQLANAVTDGGGNFVLHIPVGTATGATLVVQEINPPVYVSTGGNSGGNGGTYDRSTDRIAFTYAGNDPTGFQFGDIPEDSLLTDGAQVILPGAVAYYRHTYTAGTAGTVTFTVSTQATPSIPWTQVIVRDLNGNGQIDAGEPVINGTPITVAAGDVINLVVKENSPSGTPLGARDTITLSSTFTAANASPAIVFNRTRQDVTTIGTTTAAGLQLTKSVDKTTAAPGDVITYTITYTNVGSESLSVFFINDITPAYTTFVSAAAGALPLNLTAVVITKPTVGAAGPLRWDFTGTLAPGSSGTVTFQVQVQL